MPPATSFYCILIWGVSRNLVQQMTPEEGLAGDGGMEERSGDLSCRYLVTNHLDMNYSLSNGNPYSSSSPKALLWGCRCAPAFISSPYPLPHPCTLIKTPTYLKALHHPLTHIEFPSLSPWSLWTTFGIINDVARSYTYEYGDQPYCAYTLLYNGIDLNL